MGWWQIDLDKDELEAPRWKDSSLYNAIPGKDSKDRLYMGDEPADVLDEAIRAMDKAYRRTWSRKARRKELMALMEFCLADRK